MSERKERGKCKEYKEKVQQKTGQDLLGNKYNQGNSSFGKGVITELQAPIVKQESKGNSHTMNEMKKWTKSKKKG